MRDSVHFLYRDPWANEIVILISDYAPNIRLDNYSDADIDDGDQFEPLSAAARRAAEAKMARRDREQGGSRKGLRASRRNRAPAFLQMDESEDEDDPSGGLLAGMKPRTRRHWDERRDVDDAEGAEDVRRFLYLRAYMKLTPCLTMAIGRKSHLKI